MGPESKNMEEPQREPFLILDQSQQYLKEFAYSAMEGEFIPQQFEEEVSVEGNQISCTHLVGDIKIGQVLEISKSTYDLEDFDNASTIYDDLDDIDIDIDFADSPESQPSSEDDIDATMELLLDSKGPKNETEHPNIEVNEAEHPTIEVNEAGHPTIEVNEEFTEESIDVSLLPYEDTESVIFLEPTDEEVAEHVMLMDVNSTAQITQTKFVTKLKHINLFVSL